MKRFERILFPTDFSDEAEQAYDYAGVFAQLFDAEVHVLHVDKEDVPSPVMEHLADRARETLGKGGDISKAVTYQTLKALSDQKTSIIEALAHRMNAGDIILDYASKWNADLIVMGKHGRAGIVRLITGSTSEYVLRRAPCPVLTAREGQHFDDDRLFSRIVIPVDFNIASESAVAFAGELAESLDADTTLLHVVEEEVLPMVYGAMPTQEQQEKHLRQCQEKLEAIRAKYFANRSAQCIVVQGKPDKAIIDHTVSYDTHLVIIPTHGYKGIKRLVLGSVAEQVVRKSPCPVLTFRPDTMPELEKPIFENQSHPQ